MAPKPPLRRVAQAVSSAASSGVLGVDRRAGNALLRFSMALLCVGLALQALSSAADPYRCGALVKHGAWPPYTRPKVDATLAYEQLEALEQEGREPPPARPFDEWEPAGCRMHEYSRDDVRECLGGQRLLFVGDATARVLFFAALTRLEHQAAERLLRLTFIEENPRHDLSVDAESVHLDFLWDPWLNSTTLDTELSRIVPPNGGNTEPSSDGLPPKPGLVVVGSAGLWAARNAADTFLEVFQTSTDRIARTMAQEVRPDAATNVFLTPVTVPRYEALPPDRAETLSPARIRAMNRYLDSLPRSVQSHILTVYNEMTYHVPEAYEDTGLYVTAAVAERGIDILFNARCNGLLSQPGRDDKATSLTYKATCCVAYPDRVRGQTALWFALWLAVVGPVVLRLARGRAPSPTHLSCSFLALAVLYCYVADRSHAFPKTEKQYSAGGLGFLLLAVGVAFAASRRHVQLDKSAPASEAAALRHSAAHNAHALDVQFLPRRLTDEWKGLMQAVFLLLAYQDRSETLALSRWTELFTNAYLFLSAYGHTLYFLRTGDFASRRVVSVLFRLNALPCLLALMLDGLESGTQRSVSRLCSFTWLVSFWFLVTYTTLRVGSHNNGSRPDLLLTRICVSAAISVSALTFPGKYGVFEMASRAGFALSGASWNIEDMRLAVCYAWCAPFAGMAVAVTARRAAFVCDRMQLQQDLARRPGSAGRASWSDSKGHYHNTAVFASSWLDRLLASVLYPNELTAPLQPMAVIFAFVYFFSFANITAAMPVVEGAAPHPGLTSMAVVCFAVLRNSHRELRATFMPLPAALGKVALELYALRNHIWLSGNGTGRLRLFSIYTTPSEGYELLGGLANARVAVVHCLEVASISTLFVWMCWRAHEATRLLSVVLFGAPGGSDGAGVPSAAAAEMRLSNTGGNGRYRLPLYDDDDDAGDEDGADLSSARDDAEGRTGRGWASDARLRGSCILVLLWGMHKLYI